MHAGKVVAVTRPQLVPGVRANGAAVVNGLRPRVSNQVGQTLAEALRHSCAEGMVVRVVAAVYFLNPAVVWPGGALRNGPGVSRPALQDGLVVKPLPRQLVAFVSLVADLQHDVFRQLALDVKQPLVHIWRTIAGDGGQKLGRSQTGSTVPGTDEGLPLVKPRIAHVLIAVF